jgi:hypothetical protein
MIGGSDGNKALQFVIAVAMRTDKTLRSLDSSLDAFPSVVDFFTSAQNTNYTVQVNSSRRSQRSMHSLAWHNIGTRQQVPSLVCARRIITYVNSLVAYVNVTRRRLCTRVLRESCACATGSKHVGSTWLYCWHLDICSSHYMHDGLST